MFSILYELKVRLFEVDTSIDQYIVSFSQNLEHPVIKRSIVLTRNAVTKPFKHIDTECN